MSVSIPSALRNFRSNYNRTRLSFWHMSRFTYVISPHILQSLPQQSQDAHANPQRNKPRNSVAKFCEHHFKTPSLPPCDVVVAVESPEAVMACVTSRSLRQVSAPESLFAYIMAVWESDAL